MDEIHKLQSLVKEHHVTIKMNSIGCSWLSVLTFDGDTKSHHFACKDLKDLFIGMIEEVEKKYKE